MKWIKGEGGELIPAGEGSSGQVRPGFEVAMKMPRFRVVQKAPRSSWERSPSIPIEDDDDDDDDNDNDNDNEPERVEKSKAKKQKVEEVIVKQEEEVEEVEKSVKGEVVDSTPKSVRKRQVPVKALKFGCSTCGKRYARRSDKIRHEKVCRYCSKCDRFVDVRHLNKCSGRKFTSEMKLCPICHVFRSSRNFRRHLSSVHGVKDEIADQYPATITKVTITPLDALKFEAERLCQMRAQRDKLDKEIEALESGLLLQKQIAQDEGLDGLNEVQSLDGLIKFLGVEDYSE